jgi:hypothetical protein
MRGRPLLILVIILLALVPLFYLNRWMQRKMRPRESAAGFFLFLFANFVLIVVYTLFVVGLIVTIFGKI